MRITKVGKDTRTVYEELFVGQCAACFTEVEFTEREAMCSAYDGVFYINCPHCFTTIIRGIKKKYITTEVPIEGKS